LKGDVFPSLKYPFKVKLHIFMGKMIPLELIIKIFNDCDLQTKWIFRQTNRYFKSQIKFRVEFAKGDGHVNEKANFNDLLDCLIYAQKTRKRWVDTWQADKIEFGYCAEKGNSFVKIHREIIDCD
jgi:hypothetical protein